MNTATAYTPLFQQLLKKLDADFVPLSNSHFLLKGYIEGKEYRKGLYKISLKNLYDTSAESIEVGILSIPLKDDCIEYSEKCVFCERIIGNKEGVVIDFAPAKIENFYRSSFW